MRVPLAVILHDQAASVIYKLFIKKANEIVSHGKVKKHGLMMDGTSLQEKM